MDAAAVTDARSEVRMPVALAVLAPLLAAALLVAGCGSDDRGDDAERVRRWTRGGVRVVESRRPGQGVREMRDDRVWRVRQVVAPDGGHRWERPVAVRASSGRIVVLDDQAKQLVVLGDGGEVVRTLAGAGSGPGEMKDPTELEVVGDDIVVLDRGRARILRYSGTGSFVEGIPLSSVPWSMFPAGPDLVGLRVQQGSSEAYRAVRVGGRESGPSVTKGPSGLAAMEPASTGHLTPQGAEPCVRRDGSRALLARSSCYMPVIDLFRPSGEAVRRIRLDEEPRPTAPGVLDSLRQEIGKRVRSVLDGEKAERVVERTVRGYRYHRRFHGVRFVASDSLLYLWEQPPAFARTDDRSAAVHVVRAGGAYVARLEFGARWADFDVDGRRIYAVTVRPATGLRSVTAWRLPALDRVREEGDG